MKFPKPSRSEREKAKRKEREDEILKRGEMRHDCLMRAKYLCELCGKSLATTGFEWHHVHSGSGKRREWEAVETTICLCPECHRAVHASKGEALDGLMHWAIKYRYKTAYAEVERRYSKLRDLG